MKLFKTQTLTLTSFRELFEELCLRKIRYQYKSQNCALTMNQSEFTTAAAAVRFFPPTESKKLFHQTILTKQLQPPLLNAIFRPIEIFEFFRLSVF